MRILICVLALLCPSVAYAADMPVKNPPPIGYPDITGNGWYGGIGTFVETSSSSVSTGGATANFNSTGAAIEGVLGYQYRVPGFGWGFTEIGVNYANLGGQTLCNVGGAAAGCSVAGPWGFTVGTAVGFNWTYPFTYLSAFAGSFGGVLPSNLIPAGLVPTSSQPYAGVWADINQMHAQIDSIGSTTTWQVTPAIGIGLLNYLPNKSVLDTRVKYEFADTSFAVGPGAAAKKGGTLWLEGIFKY